ncbi:DHH family phosphoesterase [Thalassotalea agariperforans]
MHFDVFNGDADGILALVQLRLAEPKESTLITGVKRDISLLKQVDKSQATSVTVLDISMEKNIDALNELLAANIPVSYTDHHRAGDIPSSSLLTANIDTDANTCTSLLVNQQLGGQFANWAIAAAFGDNMTASAVALAESVGLTQAQQEKLKAFGIYVNYNGYGRTVDDLHYKPDALFQLLVQHADPLTLVEQEDSVFSRLEKAYQADMALAESAKVLVDNDICKVVELADEAWARRVSGVFGNELANRSPNKAHAVVTQNADGTYTISLRAPLNNKQGASDICVQFPTGGGRAGAAGINNLPAEQLDLFIATLSDYYR